MCLFPCLTLKNLGVALDFHLTMKTHVSNLVCSANFELCRISSTCHLLSTVATKTLVSAFVLSRLYYCNSLLFGCPQNLQNKLQKVQKNAARLVLRVSKTDHISHHLASLHWLPIDSRIQYKLSYVCYNCLNSAAPDYLTELLRIYKPTRQLCSSSVLPFFLFPLYAHTRLVKGHFLMLRRQSGTLSLTTSGHPTPPHPSNHHLKLIFFSSPTDSVCVCVGEREREREKKKRERES